MNPVSDPCRVCFFQTPYHSLVREDVVSDHHLSEGSPADEPPDDVTIVHNVAGRTCVPPCPAAGVTAEVVVVRVRKGRFVHHGSRRRLLVMVVVVVVQMVVMVVHHRRRGRRPRGARARARAGAAPPSLMLLLALVLVLLPLLVMVTLSSAGPPGSSCSSSSHQYEMFQKKTNQGPSKISPHKMQSNCFY